jgi:hypothetical protein
MNSEGLNCTVADITNLLDKKIYVLGNGEIGNSPYIASTADAVAFAASRAALLLTGKGRRMALLTQPTARMRIIMLRYFVITRETFRTS